MVSVHAPASRAATLLFCHGGGFCKDVWTPIITRLQRSPTIQQAAPKMVTFDFPYHGSNRNVSEPATLHLENPEAPRVSHPAMHWAKWSKEEVERQVRLLRAQEQDGAKTPLIGIGHSMGAAALWATEAANPGTFDGLVLFEPMVNVEDVLGEKSINFLVSITLQRKAKWDSFEQAETEILALDNFGRWDRESLKNYVKGAVVKASPENNVLDPEGKFVLSCHPYIESSLYSGPTLRLSEEKMAGVRCPITFNYGGRTKLFLPQVHQHLVDKYPHLYRIAEAVPETTHALVMEDPDTITDRILDSLGELTPFRRESRL